MGIETSNMKCDYCGYVGTGFEGLHNSDYACPKCDHIDKNGPLSEAEYKDLLKDETLEDFAQKMAFAILNQDSRTYDMTHQNLMEYTSMLKPSLEISDHEDFHKRVHYLVDGEKECQISSTQNKN